MTFTALDWQRRFIQQATWTRDLRQFLYQQVGLPLAQAVLDVGCGPGALEPEIRSAFQGMLVGLDIDQEHLNLARLQSPGCSYIQGDAHKLPFQDGSFNICLCHFVLLWLTDPLIALKEMRRVTQKSGWVLILAEPDYSGRLDYPEKLAQLGAWQRQSLTQQGADPALGRRLARLCQQAGLQGVQFGVLGGQWGAKNGFAVWEQEWQVLENDLAVLLHHPPPQDVAMLRALDYEASQNGERVLFVPTFYAWGRAA